MTNVFFSLLSSEIGGQVNALPSTLSYEELEELYRLASAHDVAHIVGQALSKCGCLGEDNISKQFKTAAMNAVMRYVQLQHSYEKICTVLETAQIPFIPLKGAVLRSYYPEPWMRTSCDVDILVKPEDLDRAVTVLCEELQCTRGGTTSHDVALQFPDGVQLELHYDTIESAVSPASAAVLQEIWQEAIPLTSLSLDEQPDNPYHLVLPNALFYIYHIAHMAKHLINGGCGIRPFLDLFLLGTSPHDVEERKELLHRSGLSAFADAAETLTGVWFCGTPADETSLKLADYILRGGSYGTVENYVTVHRAQQGTRWGYVWSRVWLRYDVIKFYYPVLQKHAWLTPLYQVVRWFNVAFGGRAASAAYELKRNAALSDDTVQSTQTLLQDLNLL